MTKQKSFFKIMISLGLRRGRISRTFIQWKVKVQFARLATRFQLDVKHTKTGLRKANLALDRYICKRKQKKKTRDTNSATNATFSIHYCLFLNTCLVPKKGISSNCAKLQKYNRAKQVSNFFTCGANNVHAVSDYKKR